MPEWEMWVGGFLIGFLIADTAIGILLVAAGWLGQVMFHLGMRYLDAEDE